MALLMVNLDRMIGNAQLWRDEFAEQLPDLDIRIWPDNGDPAEVEYLAFMRPDFDTIPALPNLKAMFSRSAGVEAFINHPKLPKVPLGKIEPDGGDPMMTEYTVMHVLHFHREMPKYQQAQANKQWLRTRIVRSQPGCARRAPRRAASRYSTATTSSRHSCARPTSWSACCR
jgi:glyoxylate/hydroxypyruvate reductase A